MENLLGTNPSGHPRRQKFLKTHQTASFSVPINSRSRFCSSHIYKRKKNKKEGREKGREEGRRDRRKEKERKGASSSRAHFCLNSHFFDGIQLLNQDLDGSQGFWPFVIISCFPQFLDPCLVCLPQLPATADQQTTKNPEGRSHKEKGRKITRGIVWGPVYFPALGTYKHSHRSCLSCKGSSTLVQDSRLPGVNGTLHWSCRLI